MDKKCGKCKETKPLYCFNRDRSRVDGLDWRCAECKRKAVNKFARQNREKHYYKKNINGRADKAKACAAARKQWSVALAGKCCVIMGCLRPYKELAHIDYSKPLEVLPLCKEHHKVLDKRD